MLREELQTPYPLASERTWLDLVVIARDRHIRTRPQELRPFKEHGLRVFWIAGNRDLPTWDWLVRLVRHLDAIDGIVHARGPGPWFYAVNERSIKEMGV